MEREILLLGDEKLYDMSVPVTSSEWSTLETLENDLHDTLMGFRKRYGVGRAIAAPQIGVKKRVIYMYIDHPILMVNPKLTFLGEDKIEVLDDCMSFPYLLVRLERYKKCQLSYTDREGNEQSILLEDDLSELIQHEYDHLDGILATMRAKHIKDLVHKKP